MLICNNVPETLYLNIKHIDKIGNIMDKSNYTLDNSFTIKSGECLEMQLNLTDVIYISNIDRTMLTNLPVKMFEDELHKRTINIWKHPSDIVICNQYSINDGIDCRNTINIYLIKKYNDLPIYGITCRPSYFMLIIFISLIMISASILISILYRKQNTL